MLEGRCGNTAFLPVRRAPYHEARARCGSLLPCRSFPTSRSGGSVSDEAAATECVRSERRDAVALLTLDRPQALNALDRATLEQLRAHVAGIASDATVRAVVVTGAGRAFAAGADIAEMRGLDPLQAEAFSRLGHAALAALEALPVPTIAAVNGFALGGGCELALACDWIYASSKARFG